MAETLLGARRVGDMSKGWIGVDLDGTLAEYDPEAEFDVEHIGKPIKPMVEMVKQWLKEGKDVRIFTARVSHDNTKHGILNADFARMPIMDWCVKHIGAILPITCEKDYHMIKLYDDRCVQVVTNEGRLVWGDE